MTNMLFSLCLGQTACGWLEETGAESLTKLAQPLQWLPDEIRRMEFPKALPPQEAPPDKESANLQIPHCGMVS